MKKQEFVHIRKELGKTQKQMAELLGTSLKAVHSYEQGWRRIPIHAERQTLFLFALKKEKDEKIKSCWIIKKCPSAQKRQCPAWEFRAGKLCWFINGTICQGTVQQDWGEKIKMCRTCEVFTPLLTSKAKGV
jgi:DNA-binding XRE family transcriptional regulator